MEKAAIKQKDNLMDEKEVTLQWYTPVKYTFDEEYKPCLTNPGGNSKEVQVQAKREAGVLQALYFNRDMTPSTPAEPDATETNRGMGEMPKPIPLEDKESDESSYQDYSKEGWPEPKVNQVDRHNNIETAFSLPPALSNLLSTIRHSRFSGNLTPSRYFVQRRPVNAGRSNGSAEDVGCEFTWSQCRAALPSPNSEQ